MSGIRRPRSLDTDGGDDTGMGANRDDTGMGEDSDYTGRGGFFWNNLRIEMSEFKKSKNPSPDEFLKHFRGKVPIEGFPSSTVPSETTGPDQSSIVPAAASFQAAHDQGEETANKDRIRALVHTDTVPEGTSSKECLEAIKQIKNTVNKEQKKIYFLRNKKQLNAWGPRLDNLRRILPFLLYKEKAEEDKKKAEEDKKKAEEALLLREKKAEEDNVRWEVDVIADKTDIVRLHLQVLGNLSTETKKTLAEHTIGAKQEKKRRKIVDLRPSGDRFVEQLNPLQARTDLLNNQQTFEDFNDSNMTLEKVIAQDEDNVSQEESTVIDDLQTVATIYQALFRNACFLRREDDCQVEKYQSLLEKAVSFLNDAAGKIRDGTMSTEERNQLIKNIENENADKDLVQFVTSLQNLRSKLNDRDRKKTEMPPLENPGGKFQGHIDSINETEGRDKQVDAINNVLNDLMPQLMWLPGPTAQEVHGAQVLFGALLDAISACLPRYVLANNTPSGDERKTPSKNAKHEERKVATDGNRQNRYVDFTVFKGGRFRVCLHDDTFELTIELKPYQRLASDVKECQNEALNQGLSHAGKALYPALNLGPGFPAHAIFIVGTVLHVTVYRLELTNPGTKDAALQLKASNLLPLVPKDCYERYVESDPRHTEEDASFCTDLYRPEGSNSSTTNVAGIPALAKVMTSSQGTLFRLDHPSSKSFKLLGFGAFGLVLDIGDNQVLKLSRFGNWDELAHEVAALKHLAKHKDGDDDAARVISLGKHGMIDVPYRGVSVKLPGVILSPKGVRAESIEPVQLSQVASDLLRGLSFLHNRGMGHGDMSDSNFVLYNGRAVITDLACARPLKTVMDNFLGTPDFVHPDIHTEPSWMFLAIYDIAALVHALCTLCNSGKTPWSTISVPQEKKESLKLIDRQDKTMEWLRQVANPPFNLEDTKITTFMESLQFSNKLEKCKCQKNKNEMCKQCKCKTCTILCPCNGNCSKSLKPDFTLEKTVFTETLEIGTVNDDGQIGPSEER